MDEISFEKVHEIWQQVSGQKNTFGVLLAFNPLTERWLEGQIDAKEIGELRFIGGAPGDRFTDLTNGLYTIKSLPRGINPDSDFKWDQTWRIICLEDPQMKTRVIIDGNGRALQVFLQMRNGIISETSKFGIIVGELVQPFVFCAKAVTPLWK